MDNKQKHLEFIHNTINRMASNLFMLKGWSITLIAAVFGFATKDSNYKFLVFAYLLVVIFWVLDGYFLSQERRFRSLYKDVASKKEEEIDYTMDTLRFNVGRNTWWASVGSLTISIFYLALTISMAIVALLIS